MSGGIKSSRGQSETGIFGIKSLVSNDEYNIFEFINSIKLDLKIKGLLSSMKKFNHGFSADSLQLFCFSLPLSSLRSKHGPAED